MVGGDPWWCVCPWQTVVGGHPWRTVTSNTKSPPYKETTTTTMTVVYYAYQIASCLIRHVLVPVLLADPRSTMVLIAYVAAYLR